MKGLANAYERLHQLSKRKLLMIGKIIDPDDLMGSVGLYRRDLLDKKIMRFSVEFMLVRPYRRLRVR